MASVGKLEDGGGLGLLVQLSWKGNCLDEKKY